MLHAGVLKKFGLYALIRVALPMLPDGARSLMPLVAWLALGNLVYCGWVAMRQKDFSWLAGYSSVAHMGFVFLGLAALNLIGITGAVVVMIAHGFLAALSSAFGLSLSTSWHAADRGIWWPAAATAVHRHGTAHGCFLPAVVCRGSRILPVRSQSSSERGRPFPR